MSSNVLEGVMVPENMVRDFLNSQAGLAVNYIFDIQNTGNALGLDLFIRNRGNALGLDLFIRNRGAAALTVSLNGAPAVTVDPGDVYVVNNFKFWLITVLSVVLYDLQIFGIHITTLKKKGLM